MDVTERAVQRSVSGARLELDTVNATIVRNCLIAGGPQRRANGVGKRSSCVLLPRQARPSGDPIEDGRRELPVARSTRLYG